MGTTSKLSKANQKLDAGNPKEGTGDSEATPSARKTRRALRGAGGSGDNSANSCLAETKEGESTQPSTSSLSARTQQQQTSATNTDTSKEGFLERPLDSTTVETEEQFNTKVCCSQIM